ncbi:MAG: hypothetical protein CMP23_14500 [Rickettsiales bacterium]|nr:hypothetical protein [Rickettsiales bacterium]|tara:strand:- start:1406 stop:1996 length:591 start_codon:yes stop_codon:yes gene_type:complete
MLRPPTGTARIAAITLVVALLFSCSAQARDLRGRFALGFNNNFSSFSSISAKVGLPTSKPTLNVQIQALIGFSIATLVEGAQSQAPGSDQFFAGGRVLLPMLAEDNLNIYCAIGAGYVRQRAITATERQDDPSVAVTHTGNVFRAQGALGVEFFLFGLENLGLSAELGIRVDADPGFVAVQTTAGGAASVGIHYYF